MKVFGSETQHTRGVKEVLLRMKKKSRTRGGVSDEAVKKVPLKKSVLSVTKKPSLWSIANSDWC